MVYVFLNSTIRFAQEIAQFFYIFFWHESFNIQFTWRNIYTGMVIGEYASPMAHGLH